MTCEHIRKILSSYMDGMTNQQETRAVKAHLQHCPACRKELEQLKEMHAVLQQVPDLQAPADFPESITKKMKDRQNTVFASREPGEPRKASWMVACIMGVVLIVGIAISSLLPAGTIVSIAEKYFAQEEGRNLAIGPILERILSEGNQKDDATTQQEQNDIILAGQPSKKLSAVKTKEVLTSGIDQGESGDETESLPVTIPKLAHFYFLRINTSNAEETIAQVRSVSAPYLITAASDDQAERLYIHAGKSQADSIIKELRGLGAAESVRDTLDYTYEYSVLSSLIQQKQSQVQTLKAQENLTGEEQDTLQRLNADIKQMQKKQKEINQCCSRVEIEVAVFELSLK